MRILLIGPNHSDGSIPPYLDVFAAALQLLGAQVDRLGSSGVPYDKREGRFWPADQVVQAARDLLRDVDLNAYDVLSVHFGNLFAGMPVGEGLRLGIDLGAAAAVAVVVGADGRADPVAFDGSPGLPAGGFAEPGSGRLVTGVEAWRRGLPSPESFEASPVRRLRDESVRLGGREVAPVDLVAATLAHVGAAAGLDPVTADVALVVPASWGPRRRTVLRRAAYRAGLGQPRLVEAPVAVASYLLAEGVRIPAGRSVLVCDAGAGFEASVVRRVDDGFDVLASIEDSAAGGDAVDAALAAWLARAVPGTVDGSGADLALLADARTAKEALASTVSVVVPVGDTSVVLDTARLRKVAGPVLAAAAQVARRALDAAEVPAADLAGVFLVGGGAGLPGLTDALGDELGVAVTVPARPRLAAALGAARAVPAGPAAVSPDAPLWPARLRDNVHVLVPALAAMALFVAFLATTDRYDGGGVAGGGAFLVANWGCLALAAVLATLAALAAGTVGVSAMAFEDRPGGRRTGSRLLGTVLPGAAVAGATVATVCSALAAAFFAVPAGPLLGWALAATVPVGVAASTVGVAAFWRPVPPGGSWVAFLRFPVTAVVVAAAGMLLMQYAFTSRIPWADADVLARCGAGLVGAGIGLLAARRWRTLAITVTLFAGIAALVAGLQTTALLGGGFVAAATLWWLRDPTHRHADPLQPPRDRPRRIDNILSIRFSQVARGCLSRAVRGRRPGRLMAAKSAARMIKTVTGAPQRVPCWNLWRPSPDAEVWAWTGPG